MVRFLSSSVPAPLNTDDPLRLFHYRYRDAVDVNGSKDLMKVVQKFPDALPILVDNSPHAIAYPELAYLVSSFYIARQCFHDSELELLEARLRVIFSHVCCEAEAELGANNGVELGLGLGLRLRAPDPSTQDEAQQL